MSRIPIASAVALLISAIFLFLAAMTSTAQAAPPKRGGPFQDPVSYCRAVRTIDWPDRDRRYAGPKEVAWIDRAMGYRRGDIIHADWGCEDGNVVACLNGGITGPCSKVDLSRTTNHDTIAYCRSHPNDELAAACLRFLEDRGWAYQSWEQVDAHAIQHGWIGWVPRARSRA